MTDLHCADCPPGKVHTTKSDHPFRARKETEMKNRIVRVFPNTDKEFMATVIFDDGIIVKVMTQAEEVFTVGHESVLDATQEEIYNVIR